MGAAATSVRMAARHLRAVLRAVLRPSGRRRLARHVRLLRDAAGTLGAGGLPALASRLDDEPIAGPQGVAERTLKEAEAVAALWPQPGMRRCLRRAVLRYVVVRAAGGKPSLIIGATRSAAGAGLTGHAWVEVDGRPYREFSDQWRRMTETYRHPPSGGREAVPRDREALARSE